MADLSAISWTDSTWNPWVGCTKVSPACDNCYAEKWAERAGRDGLWDGKRERTKTWANPAKWQREHAVFFRLHRRRRRVFTASLADFFDNAVPDIWRSEAWSTIWACDKLEWFIVTKRIPNVSKMLPPGFTAENFGHIVIIATVVTQEEYDREVPRLKELKRKYPWLRIGLSIEPMLGRIVLDTDHPRLDWVIVGGESGGNARNMQMEWVLSLQEQCDLLGIPFHFKQVGSNHVGWEDINGKGDNPNEWPRRLRTRAFPYRFAA